MKKGLTIFLILICLFQSGGIFIIYRFHQGIIHYRIQYRKHELSTGLEELTFSLSEYQMVRVNKRELQIDGRMYDIKSMQTIGDSVFVTAYHDIREEHIIAGINRILIPVQSSDKKQTVELIKLSLLHYLVPQNEMDFQSQIIYEFKFRIFYNRWTNHSISILTPPPDWLA